MHMWHHVTNHLIISNDKDSNSENRINYTSVTHRIQPCNNAILEVLPLHIGPCFKGAFNVVLKDLNREQPDFKGISGTSSA
jgi:hypothetical protein